MEIRTILNQFGLSDKESDVYLSLLELGISGVNDIANKANIKRTTVYDILSSLTKFGLVSQTQKGKKRFFYAEEPERFNKLLQEKQSRFSEILPILKSLHNTSGVKPKIRYYEGITGLKTVYNDCLNYNDVILAFASEKIFEKLGKDFFDDYSKKKKLRGIASRTILASTKKTKEYLETSKKYLREIKIIDPKKIPFTIEMNIYANKISFISFKEEMAIIIESNEIANNMRLLFELAWKGI
jgi:HTH-type transcriptional regulator, sugar sensing transcriptional regulator